MCKFDDGLIEEQRYKSEPSRKKRTATCQIDMQEARKYANDRQANDTVLMDVETT